MIHLRDKIKKIVTKEDDLNKVMDYIYWEVSKLDGKTDRSIANKVRRFTKRYKVI